jgi:bacterioferritin-associated ferredoxin
MYICSCEAVNDQTVRAAIASGASTIDEIGARCRAGTQCGGCHVLLAQLLDDVRVSRPAARHSAA